MNKRKSIADMTERERKLLVIHKPIVCSACGETSALFSKGIGYHPYEWEMNCTLCHRYGIGLSAYTEEHKEIIESLNRLRTRFIAGSSTAELSTEIESLADHYDYLLYNSPCGCGGSLSIAAKPKCIYCDLEIFDSYFHFVDQPIDHGFQ
jgi:hypothetical protein